MPLDSDSPTDAPDELLPYYSAGSDTACLNVPFGVDLLRRRLAESEFAISYYRLIPAPPKQAESKPPANGESINYDAAIQLLQSWREADEQEQQETWEYLKRALDEDRLSDRKLFP
jgi:hypothetical protein